MSKNGSIRYQIEKELKSKCAFGESRHNAKIEGNAYTHIYSFNTMNTYLEQLNLLVDWCIKNNFKIKSLDDLKLYGDRWLQWSIDNGQSAWSIATKKSALNKLYGTRRDQYFKVKVPKKERKNIKRSRDLKKSLMRFDINKESNYNQVVFSRCTGLRIHEIIRLKFKDFYLDDNAEPWVHVSQGKGGKQREVKLYGSSEELELCIKICTPQAPDDTNKKVFPKPNKTVSTHTYRAEYCRRVYEAEKREISSLPHSEKVYLRKDLKGVVLDRKALKICSKMLGHNRTTVINSSYTY